MIKITKGVDITRAKVYMNVPYAQKDEAKALGAKWDKDVKKWYYEGSVKDFTKFGKWILGENEDAVIAYETLYIIEADRVCYRCGKETKIIGFGIGECSVLSEDGDEYFIEDPDDFPDFEDEIHLAWTDDESRIPPLLLRYIKKHYSVKTGYSSIAGKCFANHCDHCGSIQGNNYLFVEDSPLSTSTPVESELIERMGKLRIYNVYTDAALVLNWDIAMCSNDWAYAVYCKNFQDIVLSANEDDMWTSYSEMYDLN